MTTQRSKWFLAGLLGLVLWPTHASDQDRAWQSYIDAAVEAYVEGDYAEARKQFEAAVKTAEAFEPEDTRLATSLNGLAETYRAQGRTAEAEPLHKRALAIREKALGQGHPDIIQSLNNLAGLYLAQGRTAEAEPLLKRAQDLEAQVSAQFTLWQSHITSGESAYREGDYTQAEEQFAAALTVAVGFGPQDPRLATSLNNLAELYRVQGKYADAEPLYLRALAIVEKALGPEHPDVAASLNNLAALYHTQGRYAEAEPLFERSLAIREKVLGPEHPDVATSLNNLAVLYQAQGKYAEAEPLYERSLKIVEKTLGPDHPNVATSLENYAALLRETGRPHEAEEMEARARAIRAKRTE